MFIIIKRINLISHFLMHEFWKSSFYIKSNSKSFAFYTQRFLSGSKRYAAFIYAPKSIYAYNFKNVSVKVVVFFVVFDTTRNSPAQKLVSDGWALDFLVFCLFIEVLNEMLKKTFHKISKFSESNFITPFLFIGCILENQQFVVI